MGGSLVDYVIPCCFLDSYCAPGEILQIGFPVIDGRALYTASLRSALAVCDKLVPTHWTGAGVEERTLLYQALESPARTWPIFYSLILVHVMPLPTSMG